VSLCENHTNVILSRTAKNLAFPATYEGEILRLSPQDDVAMQSRLGRKKLATCRTNVV
jgi:hypothetical protein